MENTECAIARSKTKPGNRPCFGGPPGVVLGIAAAGAAGLFSASELISSVAATGQNCDIKGNISMNSGERIYHVPGQEYYSATRVSPQHGERWFCSEAEARKAGWRKSRV